MWILRVGINTKLIMVDFIKKFEVGKVTALLFLLQVIYNKSEVDISWVG